VLLRIACVRARVLAREGQFLKVFPLFIEAETPAKSTGWGRDPDIFRVHPDIFRVHPDISRLLSTGKSQKKAKN